MYRPTFKPCLEVLTIFQDEITRKYIPESYFTTFFTYIVIYVIVRLPQPDRVLPTKYYVAHDVVDTVTRGIRLYE